MIVFLDYLKRPRKAQNEQPIISDHIEASTVRSIKINVTTTLNNRSMNGVHSNKNNQLLISHSLIEKLEYEKFFCPFTRKASSICWHPRKRSVLALGGKSGEVGFVPDINKRVINREIQNFVLLQEQIGPEGELKEIKFDKINDNYFYTLTIMGQVRRWDLNNLTQHVIKPMVDSDVWFYSLDVDSNQNILYVGDNKGYVTIIYPASLCPFCFSVHFNLRTLIFVFVFFI